MVKRLGSTRKKTRKKFTKSIRNKGKISVSNYFQSYKLGDKVGLKVESSVQKGMYNPKFYGKVGTIKGKKGICYEVLLNDQNKQKTLIVHPVHLKRL